MLINRYTTIMGKDVILVPYRKEHVEKYHQWMQSTELQHLTASQPLSLEEEYNMQVLWMRDNDKLTFIVLDRALYEKNNNEIEAMVGDTNLFFANCTDRTVAEAEIMIAETAARGKHLGWQAMVLMLLYGIKTLCVKEYVVKILLDNEISIKMFDKMGFVETGRSDVFKEVTMNRIVDCAWYSFLSNSIGAFDTIVKDEFYDSP